MPRKGSVPRREPVADPKFDSVLVTRFINAIMKDGKRSIAEGHFYKAMGIVEQKTGQEAMAVLKQAMNNVKPVLEVKSRRVGGANYQVPVEVRPDRRNALATRWIITFAAARADHSFAEKFAQEILAASKNEGGAVKKREDTHKMAEANKAFAHYRWSPGCDEGRPRAGLGTPRVQEPARSCTFATDSSLITALSVRKGRWCTRSPETQRMYRRCLGRLRSKNTEISGLWPISTPARPP